MNFISTLLLFNAQAKPTPEFSRAEQIAFRQAEAKNDERHTVEASGCKDLLGGAIIFSFL